MMDENSGSRLVKDNLDYCGLGMMDIAMYQNTATPDYTLRIGKDFIIERNAIGEVFVNITKDIADSILSSRLVKVQLNRKDDELNGLEEEILDLKSKLKEALKYKNYYDLTLEMVHGK